MIEDEHHDVNWPRNQFWSPPNGGQGALTRWPHDLPAELTSGLQCVQIPDSKKKKRKKRKTINKKDKREKRKSTKEKIFWFNSVENVTSFKNFKCNNNIYIIKFMKFNLSNKIIHFHFTWNWKDSYPFTFDPCTKSNQ
jgi:hypothetical protein